MYTQIFGNYLFSKGYVTKEQLLSALMRQSKEIVHVSTLALYSGYMSASEIDYITKLQEQEGKKFSELAIENGFLTQDQVLELLNTTSPDFLVLGQIFIGDGVLSYDEFENILTDYRSQNEFLELEVNEDNKDEIQRLIDSFSILSEYAISSFGKSYLELLFNNFVRFIGDDFTALPPDSCTEFPTECCVSQLISGNYAVNTYINMDEETAIAFAERYSNESFSEFDEYVHATLEDFVNLQNGLFIVNASNDNSNELTIGTLEHHNDTILSFEYQTYHFPVCYPFGIVHFLMEIIHIKEHNVLL